MKKSKDLKSLTKLEAERQSKILAGELAEEIDTLGQDSESKAVKWVQEKEAEREKEAKVEKTDAIEKLSDVVDQSFTYRRKLYEYAVKEMKGYDLPKGFFWLVELNDKGLLFSYRIPNGRKFAKGIKISTFVREDMQAIDRFIQIMLDEMEEVEDYFINRREKKTESGIILPN